MHFSVNSSRDMAIFMYHRPLSHHYASLNPTFSINLIAATLPQSMSPVSRRPSAGSLFKKTLS